MKLLVFETLGFDTILRLEALADQFPLLLYPTSPWELILSSKRG
jgi:hypothetical protein